MKIAFILILIFLSNICLAAYRVSHTTIGTNRHDVLFGQTDTIVFGLKGNDRFFGIDGMSEDSILVGGIGSDRYYAANRGIITISDSGGRGTDRLYARNVCFYCNTSKIATYDRGRHLIFGNTRTGARIVVLDWKNSRNRIEKVYLADKNLSYNTVKRQYKRWNGYLGNLSRGSLRRWDVYMPSIRDTRNAIGYYLGMERRHQRRANRFKQGFFYEPLNSFNDVSTISLGNENHNFSYQYGKIFDSEIDQDIDVYSRSNFDEINNLSDFSNSKTNALNYSFRLNDIFEIDFANYFTLAGSDNFVLNSNDVLLHTYGVKGTLQVTDQLKIIVGSKIKKDALGFNGTSNFLNVANIRNSRISMNQIGFSYDLPSNFNLSVSYSEGSGEIDLTDNLFFAANNMKLKSYGFDLTKKQILSDTDSLVFSYSVPAYVHSASATNLTPTFFGEIPEDIKFSNDKLENYNLAYSYRLRKNSILNFSISRREYSMFPTNKYATFSFTQEF